MPEAQKPRHLIIALKGEMDGPLMGFNKDGWYGFVDYATVYSREDIRLTFKNGMQVKV